MHSTQHYSTHCTLRSIALVAILYTPMLVRRFVGMPTTTRLCAVYTTLPIVITRPQYLTSPPSLTSTPAHQLTSSRTQHDLLHNTRPLLRHSSPVHTQYMI